MGHFKDDFYRKIWWSNQHCQLSRKGGYLSRELSISPGPHHHHVTIIQHASTYNVNIQFIYSKYTVNIQKIQTQANKSNIHTSKPKQSEGIQGHEAKSGRQKKLLKWLCEYRMLYTIQQLRRAVLSKHQKRHLVWRNPTSRLSHISR